MNWPVGAPIPVVHGFREYLVNDCSGPYRAEPAIYVRRARVAASDYRAVGGAADADRHLPGDSHPRDRRGLAIYRPAARPDGRTHHLAVPALADDHGERHRAHRRQFL